MIDDKVEKVISANQEFYEAFKQADTEKMTRLWSTKHPVSVIHPGWNTLLGLEEVLMSWQQIFNHSPIPEIVCSEVWVNCLEKLSYVTCIETMNEGKLVATNIFVLEDGEWKIVHHQAGPLTRTSETAEGESIH